jgi:hypothetical protein
VVAGDLPEGADVTLLALDGEEEFEVGAELEAVLLESIAQGLTGRNHFRGRPPARDARPRMSTELFVDVTDLAARHFLQHRD